MMRIKAAAPTSSNQKSSSQEVPMDDPSLASANFWLPYFETIKFWAEVGVIASLAIGLIAARIEAPFSKRVEDARELKIAQLTKDAASLTRQNLALQQHIVDTEHALADRFIWYDVRPAFQEALSKFPGTTARLWMYPASSPDTFTLGMTIVGLMMGGKWQATLWDLRTASPIPGITVLYRKGVANSKEAAEALVSGLRSAKLTFVSDPLPMEAEEPVATPAAPATITFATSKDIPTEEAIRVFIGGKENPFR
jgi:hypothetical protein